MTAPSDGLADDQAGPARPAAGPVPGAPVSEAVEALVRWERSGAVWRVLGRSGPEVTVGLFTCDGGELMSQLSSSDGELVAYLGSRESSED